MNKNVVEGRFGLIKGKGFTLIELLVVILIIGILAAVALPQYQKSIFKTHCLEAITTLKSIVDAQEAYAYEHGEYTASLADLPVYSSNPSTQSKYFTFSCRQNGTCFAMPQKDGYPVFEFHPHIVTESAIAEYLGKHWCVISSSISDEQKIAKIRAACERLGTQDASMTSGRYYLLP